jgi:hypothetical protein
MQKQEFQQAKVRIRYNAKPKLEELDAVENKCCDKEDMDNSEDRNHLETITENQNTPYSTQASQCTTCRMSAQYIFSDVARRDSLRFTAPVMEVFREN